jgi:hypothetical protein
MCQQATSFDHPVSAGEQRVRHVHPERLGCFEVDFNFRRLIKRNVVRLFALKNVSEWGGDAASLATRIGCSPHDASLCHLLATVENGIVASKPQEFRPQPLQSGWSLAISR